MDWIFRLWIGYSAYQGLAKIRMDISRLGRHKEWIIQGLAEIRLDISRLSRFCLLPLFFLLLLLLLLLLLPPHHPLNTQQLLGISLAKPEQKSH